MNHDAVIEVRFMTTAEGGRNTPVSGLLYACPLVVKGQHFGFDCRLLLGEQCLELGKTYKIQVKFMNSKPALAALEKVAEFSLWEGKTVATGRVIEVVS